MGFQDSAYSWRARLHLGRTKPAVIAGVLAVALLIVLCAASGALQAGGTSFEIVKGPGGASASEAASSAQSAAEEAPQICVHVGGCVAHPGVCYLPAGARVAEAVEAAGGFAEGAAHDAVNLARVLSDGEQIIVPSAEEAAAAANPSVAAGSAAAPPASAAGGRVNINTADVAQLVTLDGVGEATALKIVRDREANGPFKTIEDLKRVSGIGDKKFEGLKDHICVG
ncbi:MULTISPECIES: ComEA family DNA-binding protein [unclassified Adlercreutzia]|uniref:ComEA family DNA-binding protein n=1 Tax=unclassified Adlercreutzia TaxID=2636013 RepID=UPI0013EB7143|nr:MULTISPECIES: ComEA family DNA-binding protein [unclassified Adlercreutzia]